MRSQHLALCVKLNWNLEPSNIFSDRLKQYKVDSTFPLYYTSALLYCSSSNNESPKYTNSWYLFTMLLSSYLSWFPCSEADNKKLAWQMQKTGLWIKLEHILVYCDWTLEVYSLGWSRLRPVICNYLLNGFTRSFDGTWSEYRSQITDNDLNHPKGKQPWISHCRRIILYTLMHVILVLSV